MVGAAFTLSIVVVHSVERVSFILYDFLGTVKAAPHECVVRTLLVNLRQR